MHLGRRWSAIFYGCATTLSAALTIVLIGSGSAWAVGRVEGLTLEPLLATTPTATVITGNRLSVSLPGNRTISITPWPRFLPQYFEGRQTLQGLRESHPAGPSDQVSWTRWGEKQAWLVVGSGARSSTRLPGVLDEWRFVQKGAYWAVSNGVVEHLLGAGTEDGGSGGSAGPALPALLKKGQQQWCIYLLASAPMPLRQPGIAYEAEPQLMWAAWQLEHPRLHCPDPR